MKSRISAMAFSLSGLDPRDEAVPRPGEVLALDLAAGLLVRLHERLGDRGRHIVVELRLSDPSRRQRGVLPGDENAGDAGCRHGLLVREEAVVRGDERCRVEPAGLHRLVLAREDVPVASQRIGDGIEGQYPGGAVVAGRRPESAIREDDRRARMFRSAGSDGQEQREVPAAGTAHQADARRIHPESPGVGPHVAHARRHVGAGRRMLVVGSLAEAQGGDDHPARGQSPARKGVGRLVPP